LDAILKLLISYFIGSISGSLVVGKIKGVDIRKSGSKNAGGTNAFRTQGLLFALVVVVIDIGKGFLATAYISQLDIPLAAGSSGMNTSLLMVLCGLSAILGHVYPIFFGFKGGKGAGTTVGMIAAISFPLVPIMVLIWGLILVTTGYVGLATMCTSISIPILAILLKVETPYLVPASIFIALFIIFTHRANIHRMLHGEENCFEKAMIFKRRS